MPACPSTPCVSFPLVRPLLARRAAGPVLRGIVYLLVVVYLLGWAELARAGFSIEISVDGGLPIVFLDNGPDDLNPLPFDLEIPFTVGMRATIGRRPERCWPREAMGRRRSRRLSRTR